MAGVLKYTNGADVVANPFHRDMISIIWSPTVSIKVITSTRLEITTGETDKIRIIIRGEDFAAEPDGTFSGLMKKVFLLKYEEAFEGTAAELKIAKVLLSEFLASGESGSGAPGPLTYSGVYEFLNSTGNITAKGSIGDDVMEVGPGGFDVSGGKGKDVFFALGGGWILDGGKGFDAIFAGEYPKRIAADLTAGVFTDGNSSTISRIEGIIGSDFDDRLSGDNGKNVFEGGKGDDQIDGRGGKDQIKGGRGDDTLEGGDGNDRIKGDAGADCIIGGAGDDKLSGGPGRDTFVFAIGDGDDTIFRFQKGKDIIELDSSVTAEDIEITTLPDGSSLVEIYSDGGVIDTIEFDGVIVDFSDLGF